MTTTFHVDLPAPQAGVVSRDLTVAVTDPATGTPVNSDIPVALSDLRTPEIPCPDGASVKAVVTDTDAYGQTGTNSMADTAPLPVPPVPPPPVGAPGIEFTVAPPAQASAAGPASAGSTGATATTTTTSGTAAPGGSTS